MRRSLAVFVSVVAVAVGVLTLASPVGAQQGYPPGPCIALNTTQNLGVFAVGQTVSFKLTPTCALTPGTAVTVTVNGVNIPGKVVEGDGTVLVQIQITSATTALVDDPVPVPNICGANNIVVSGISLAAGNRRVTHTGIYNVNCVAAGVVVPQPTVTTIVGQPAVIVQPVAIQPVAVQAGKLSRTGSDIGKWIGLGAALIVAGFGTVLFVRRRHAATAST